MPTITTTGTDQRLYLREDFNGQDMSVTSAGGYTYYANVPTDAQWDDISIRVTEVSDVTSAIADKTYTVADGSLYRLKETVPVYNTGGDHIGAIQIMKIEGNVLTYAFANESKFTATAGDVLLLRRDTKIAEDTISVIATRRYKYLLVRTENNSVDLIAEEMYTGVKKKF